ncbi:MAG: MBL fold metallo-hydrolase [candidate division KSB1 bacterium]|nr:MBL fold metallo-hydrolase [candidate division KSB1 bacterium]
MHWLSRKSLLCFSLLFGVLILAIRPISAGSKGLPPYLVVLGIAQDGGYPQAGCRKSCCQRVFDGQQSGRFIASLAIVDPQSGRRWLIDATPDFREQLRLLDEIAPVPTSPGLAGIFLTHAHIGHYTGLMHLGREVMGSRRVPVYGMPRMHAFIRENGPWNLLVELHNIDLRRLAHQKPVLLADDLSVTPILVPHRDEFSETVGFLIRGPNRSALYIPDIDKWERWKVRIEDLLSKVDVAFLDGTFFANGEIPGRNMSEIPHPFIVESMQRFASLPVSEKRKVRFIHLNHTNPALNRTGKAYHQILQAGLAVARQGEKVGL